MYHALRVGPYRTQRMFFGIAIKHVGVRRDVGNVAVENMTVSCRFNLFLPLLDVTVNSASTANGLFLDWTGCERC